MPPSVNGKPEGREIVASASVAPGDLQRHIGIWGATLLVIGNVIGSSIFLVSGTMLEKIPSASLLILSWVVGGVLILAGALTYAEMAVMYPRSGGLYIFLREAYGPLLAFLFGWACLLVILTGGIAAIAIGFAEYFSYFFPWLSSSHVLFAIPIAHHVLLFTANKITAVTAILLLGAVNYVSARSSNRLNAVLTVAKVLGIVSLPLLAIFWGRAHPNWIPIVPSGTTRLGASFGVATIGVLWAYDGWQYVPFAAGEIRDPQKNIPKALTLGVLLVVAIYVIVNIAYVYALPFEEMRGVVRVGEKAATVMAGAGAGRFLSVTVLTSAFGCCAAWMLVCARVFFAMARDGAFLKSVGSIHPKYGTPNVAVALTTFWAVLFAFSGSYEQVYTYVVFGGLLFGVLGGAAVFVLRYRRPEIPRAYRAWGYPIIPAVFVLGLGALLVNTLFEKPVESLAGLALIALGLPAYFYWRQKRI